MQVKAISWNLFHGRDFPPDPALFTRRSRLLRTTERNATHVQVNRDLLPEFARVLADAEWDVALLQECPPRWWNELAAACEAEAHGVLTSRNSLAAPRSLAARLNPDLIASHEGGSNLTLVRRSFPCAFSTYGVGKAHRNDEGIVESREVTIHAGRPERRAMALTRIAIAGADADDRHGERDDDGEREGRQRAGALCVANLHATTNRPDLAAADVLRAAETATEWAGDAPLLFGGDLNLRPAETPAVFAELRERFGLASPTGPQAIDHLLARGLDVIEPPRQWPPEQRELSAGQCELCEGGLALRLSDHAPVAATFAIASNAPLAARE